MFTATINVPGYLPTADEPIYFSTARDAWDYLADERTRDEDYAESDSESYSETRETLAVLSTAAHWTHATHVEWLTEHGLDAFGCGTIYGATSGYSGEHDLGLAYSVTEVNGVEIFAAEIAERLAPTYELVYVDYRDQLTAEQVGFIAAGDTDSFFDDADLQEWESEQTWRISCDIVDTLAEDIARDFGVDVPEDFGASGEREDLLHSVQERDSSDWVTQLCRNTPDVLLRVTALSEDNGYAFEDIDPADFLSRVGIDATPENVTTVRQTLAECSPEFSVCMAYWVFSASVEDLYKLGADTVRVTDPHVFIGNPFSGSGFLSERALTGTITLARTELKTDAQAFGYSVTEIYGGLAGDFSARVADAS